MWIARLAGPTKGRIVALLRRTSLTVPELAAELGVSGNAVRGHVAALERDGLVEVAGRERDTGGKPARRYRVTGAGEELFPKAYTLVLDQLLTVLAERDGEARVRDLLDEVASRSLPPVDPEAPMSKRVRTAAGVLEALGGELEIEDRPDGWLLRGAGCPLSGVVGDHPALCGLVQGLIAGVTGADVEECCDRSERPACRFWVLASAAPATGGGEARGG